MTNCGNCRFWGQNQPDSPVSKSRSLTAESGHKRCTRILHDAHGAIDYGHEGREYLVEEKDERLDEFDRIARELAVVHDGSGYRAEIWSLPTFGCVLGEAK